MTKQMTDLFVWSLLGYSVMLSNCYQLQVISFKFSNIG